MTIRGNQSRRFEKQMCLGINAINNINNSAAIAGSDGSCPEVASNSWGGIFGAIFSNGSTGEGSGSVANSGNGPTVACLFGDNLSLGPNSNGAGAGGETIISFSSGGGGGGCSSGGTIG